MELEEMAGKTIEVVERIEREFDTIITIKFTDGTSFKGKYKYSEFPWD